MKKIAIVFGVALLLADMAMAQVDPIPIENLISMYAIPIICGIFLAFVWIGGGLASVMVIYAGLKYLMSADDPAARKAARDMVMHALYAIIIIVVSGVVVRLMSGQEATIWGCEWASAP